VPSVHIGLDGNVRKGSPRGRSETTGGRICETGRFHNRDERDMELWMS